MMHNALHEAGHAVVGRLLGFKILHAVIQKLEDGYSRGHVETDDEFPLSGGEPRRVLVGFDEGTIPAPSYIRRDIILSLSGRWAEVPYYFAKERGEGHLIDPHDGAHLNRMLRHIAILFGYDRDEVSSLGVEEVIQNYGERRGKTSDQLHVEKALGFFPGTPEDRARFLAECENECKELVAKSFASIKAVAEALDEKHTLTGSEIDGIVAAAGE